MRNIFVNLHNNFIFIFSTILCRTENCVFSKMSLAFVIEHWRRSWVPFISNFWISSIFIMTRYNYCIGMIYIKLTFHLIVLKSLLNSNLANRAHIPKPLILFSRSYSIFCKKLCMFWCVKVLVFEACCDIKVLVILGKNDSGGLSYSCLIT